MLHLLLALQVLPAQHFPPVDRPESFSLTGAAAARLCGADTAAAPATLLRREALAAQPLQQLHGTPDQWVTLACDRIALARRGALSHDGPLMGTGESWLRGAERALLQALEARSTDAHAAELLGLIAMDDRDAKDFRAPMQTVERAAQGGVRAPGVLQACSDLAQRVHADSISRHCSELALRNGSDSTWHLISLARLAFRAHDTATGVRDFLRAAHTARDSVNRAEVDWHLQWFLAPAERTDWNGVASDSAEAWLRDKVFLRDVRDGQPFGARLAEHFARLEYVTANFQLRPAAMMRKSLLSMPAVAEDGTTPVNPDDTILSNAEPGSIYARMWREYDRWQTDFDDRGVVWMRFGAPEARVPWSCPQYLPSGCTTVREIWRYLIDGQTMLLNFENEGFDGSAQATRLVSGVLGSYMCDVDVVRCGATQKSIASFWAGKTAANGGAFLWPADVELLRTQDREYISTATTKDDNSPRGMRDIALSARLARLFDPVTSRPIALITWAIPLHDIALHRDDVDSAATLKLRVAQWDPAADSHRDTTLLRTIAGHDLPAHASTSFGLVMLQSSDDVTAWSVTVAEDSTRFGRAYDVTAPGLSRGDVVLSDLVVGSESGVLSWNLHGTSIPIAPAGVVNRKELVSVYYQVMSRGEEPALRTTAAWYRIDKGVREEKAALEVGYAQGVHAGLNEVQPSLDVSQLPPGHYVLEIRLDNGNGKELVRRSVEMVIE